MYCPSCGIRIPYNKENPLVHCTMCTNEFIPEVADIMTAGLGDVVKEQRPKQLELAEFIERTLGRTGDVNRNLFIEGGTGIGKSFAYLIPAMLKQQENRLLARDTDTEESQKAEPCTVVATPKIGLQQQLFNKDIPYLKEKLGVPIRAMLYKGNAHYGCAKLIKEVPAIDKRKFQAFTDKAFQEKRPCDVSDWDGDRPIWWDTVSAANCPLGNNCNRAQFCKPSVAGKNLIVVNHHILAIALTSPKRRFPMLGEFDTLIVDEAHQLSHAFRSVLATKFSIKQFNYLSDMLLNDDGLMYGMGQMRATLRLDVRSTRTHLEKLLNVLLGTRDPKTQMLDIGKCTDADLGVTSRYEDNILELRLSNLSDNIKRYSDNKRVSLEGQHTNDAGEVTAHIGKLRRISRAYDSALKFVQDLIKLKSVAREDRDYILTAEETKQKKYIPVLQPVDIREKLHSVFVRNRTNIFVSATLTLPKDGEPSFEHYIESLGIEGTGLKDPLKKIVSTKVVSSPFDLKHQMALYTPRHTPLPPLSFQKEEYKNWVHAIATEITDMITISKGGAFVLFTAKSDLEAVFEAARFMVPLTEVNLLVHSGDVNRTLNIFKKNNNNVLFGLKNYWEGVDVVGPDLRLVIIPKLPFPNPQDPIIRALCDKVGKDKFFNKVYIPPMISDLRQGVGRLIRSKSDKGVVAILDPRVWSGSKARHNSTMQIINNSPPFKRRSYNYGRRIIEALEIPTRIDKFALARKLVQPPQ